MRRYVSNIDVTSVALGAGTGTSLTTGDENVLLGANAGMALTTGSRNVIVGGYRAAGEPALSDAVVLASASGAVRARWDADGTATLAVAPLSSGSAPPTDLAPGTARLGYDAATGGVVWQVCDAGGARHTTVTVDPVAAAGASLETEPAAGAAGAVSLVGATSGATAGVLRTKGLVAGAGIKLSTDGDTVTLENTSTTAGVTLADAGAGAAGSVGLTADGLGPSLAVRRLVAGAGVDLAVSADGTGVVVTNASPADALSLASATPSGGAPPPANSADLVVAGTYPALTLRRVVGGAGVTVAADATGVTVSATPPATLAAEGGVGETLVGAASTSAAPTVKRLAAGAGLAVASSGTTVTLSNASPASSVTASTPAAAAANSADLVLGGAGPNLTLRRVQGGSGLGVAVTGDTVTLSALTTLGSESGDPATTESLVGGGSAAPSLTTKRLQAGWGLRAASTASVVTLGSLTPVVAVVRPADVTLTTGSLVVRSGSLTLTPSGTWPADATPYPVPSIVLRAVAPYAGSVVALVGGLPATANAMGFDVEVTTTAAGAAAACTWTVVVSRATGGSGGGGGTSNGMSAGSLAVPARAADGPPATRTVAWSPSANFGYPDSSPAVTCHDGVLRPAFGVVTGNTAVNAVEALCLTLGSSAAQQSVDIHILGVRLTLYPPA